MVLRVRVALNFPRSTGSAILYAKHIAAMMTGNAYFPSPTVPIATLVAHIADLEAAEVVTKTRAHGTAARRDEKRSVVDNDLKQLRAYVETIATQHGEDAEAVVVSSGMSVKGSTVAPKPSFAVKQGRVSGSVRLTVRHPGIVASFDWQYATDGVHWQDAPSNVHAAQDVVGLTPGTRYSFRYRTLTRNGPSDWSDPLTFLVV